MLMESLGIVTVQITSRFSFHELCSHHISKVQKQERRIDSWLIITHWGLTFALSGICSS
jgi:hypothetical protein